MKQILKIEISRAFRTKGTVSYTHLVEFIRKEDTGMEKVDFVSEYITGFPEPCCMRQSHSCGAGR